MQTNNRHIIFSPATWEQAAAVDHRSASWLHLWIKFLEPLVYCYLATSPATWEQAAAVHHHSASWLHLWIEFLMSLVYWTQFHSKCITWSMNTILFKAYEPNWLLLQPFNQLLPPFSKVNLEKWMHRARSQNNHMKKEKLLLCRRWYIVSSYLTVEHLTNKSDSERERGGVEAHLGDGGRCGHRPSMRSSQSQDTVGPSRCRPRPSMPMTLSH